MKFTGKVFFRSSAAPATGPPGEAEVQRLNPQRATTILEATGWPRLEPGSLNLKVERSVVSDLEKHTPAIEEDGDTIRYPDRYKHIPKRRKGYWYYKATLSRSGPKQDVLVRRAINPAGIRDRVEIFASVSLKKEFALKDGNVVTIEVE